MISDHPRNWTPPALFGLLAVVIALVVAGRPGAAQQKGDWPSITGGDTSTRYSALDQINAANFNTLKVAWEWNGEIAPGVTAGDVNARSLPIYVDGMLWGTDAWLPANEIESIVVIPGNEAFMRFGSSSGVIAVFSNIWAGR